MYSRVANSIHTHTPTHTNSTLEMMTFLPADIQSNVKPWRKRKGLKVNPREVVIQARSGVGEGGQKD